MQPSEAQLQRLKHGDISVIQDAETLFNSELRAHAKAESKQREGAGYDEYKCFCTGQSDQLGRGSYCKKWPRSDIDERTGREVTGMKGEGLDEKWCHVAESCPRSHASVFSGELFVATCAEDADMQGLNACPSDLTICPISEWCSVCCSDFVTLAGLCKQCTTAHCGGGSFKKLPAPSPPTPPVIRYVEHWPTTAPTPVRTPVSMLKPMQMHAPVPTPAQTQAPTPVAQTPAPTYVPTNAPTNAPTNVPTIMPTPVPPIEPTAAPTPVLVATPTVKMTPVPSPQNYRRAKICMRQLLHWAKHNLKMNAVGDKFASGIGTFVSKRPTSLSDLPGQS